MFSDFTESRLDAEQGKTEQRTELYGIILRGSSASFDAACAPITGRVAGSASNQAGGASS